MTNPMTDEIAMRVIIRAARACYGHEITLPRSERQFPTHTTDFTVDDIAMALSIVERQARPVFIESHELNTVLAGLRALQKFGSLDTDLDLINIATDERSNTAMSDTDIDDLCEYLNTGERNAT